MAIKAAELTVEVSFDMTERSHEVLRAEMRALLHEALTDGSHSLRGYIESVVRDVLGEELRHSLVNAPHARASVQKEEER
jgi:hypothetical protein